MGRSVLSTMIHQYFIFQFTDTKGGVFTHVVHLEAWSLAVKLQALACEI